MIMVLIHNCKCIITRGNKYIFIMCSVHVLFTYMSIIMSPLTLWGDLLFLPLMSVCLSVTNLVRSITLQCLMGFG